MIGTILKWAFAGLILTIFVSVLNNTGGAAAITNQTNHFTDVFKFIIGNIKNLSSTFPWVLDVILMFTAVLVIEGILVFWKVFNWITNKYN